MLKHYNIVPLRDFSSAISNRYNSNRYRRLGEENQYLDEPEEEEDVEGDGNRENRRERRLSRDLEEGFKDDSDDEGGDDRLRISRDTTRDESRVEG